MVYEPTAPIHGRSDMLFHRKQYALVFLQHVFVINLAAFITVIHSKFVPIKAQMPAVVYISELLIECQEALRGLGSSLSFPK